MVGTVFRHGLRGKQTHPVRRPSQPAAQKKRKRDEEKGRRERTNARTHARTKRWKRKSKRKREGKRDRKTFAVHEKEKHAHMVYTHIPSENAPNGEKMARTSTGKKRERETDRASRRTEGRRNTHRKTKQPNESTRHVGGEGQNIVKTTKYVKPSLTHTAAGKGYNIYRSSKKYER